MCILYLGFVTFQVGKCGHLNNYLRLLLRSRYVRHIQPTLNIPITPLTDARHQNKDHQPKTTNQQTSTNNHQPTKLPATIYMPASVRPFTRISSSRLFGVSSKASAHVRPSPKGANFRNPIRREALFGVVVRATEAAASKMPNVMQPMLMFDKVLLHGNSCVFLCTVRSATLHVAWGIANSPLWERPC